MLCLSFYEWRCIDAGEQTLLAPFLGKTSRDRAPGRFADFLFAPKHENAEVLLTTNMGPVRSGRGRGRCLVEWIMGAEKRMAVAGWGHGRGHGRGG